MINDTFNAPPVMQQIVYLVALGSVGDDAIGDNLLKVVETDEETSIFEKSNVKIFGVVLSSSSLLLTFSIPFSPFNFSPRGVFVSDVVVVECDRFLSFLDDAR
jgi:hypothetical protein